MSGRVNPADLLAMASPYLNAEIGYLFFLHNWEDGLEERRVWKTEILPAKDRTEQRIGLRRQPRRSWDLQLLVSDHGRRRLETWIGQRVVHYLVVPVWRDQATLQSPVAAGAGSLPVTTAHTEYSAGSMVAVWDAWNHFEVRKVVGVAADSVTLDSVLSESWPVGTMVAPCRFALCNEQRDISRFTEEVAAFNITVGTLWEPDFPVLVNQEAYLDLLVCPFTPSWEGPEESVSNQWTILDRETGLYEYTVQAVEPLQGRSAKFLVIGRERIDTFIRFLHTVAGRLNPFWMAANDRGFELVGTASAGETTMTIENLGYANDLGSSAARTHIELSLIDGTIIRREIVGAEATDNLEVLAIDSTLPVDVSAANCNRCAWLEQVRLDSDEITLKWVAPDCLECTLPIAVLP